MCKAAPRRLFKSYTCYDETKRKKVANGSRTTPPLDPWTKDRLRVALGVNFDGPPAALATSRVSFDRQDDVRRPIVFVWTPEPRDRFVLGAYFVNRQIQRADFTAPGPFLRRDNCVLGQGPWNTVRAHSSHASVAAFRDRCSQPLNYDIRLSAWSPLAWLRSSGS